MARNVWSDRPLGVKLAALVAVGAVSLGAFAVVSVQALNATGEKTGHVLDGAEATGDALMADMMHDAVRGDVLAALLSVGVGSAYESAATDLEEHSATFRAIFAEMHEDDLSPDVIAAVEQVTPAVEDYLASAAQIVELAGIDAAQARAAYPQFGEAFSALEEELPVLEETVTAFAENAAAEAAEQRSTAIRLSLIVAAAGVLILALLGWVITRSVVRPLRRVVDVVTGLAD